jgi:CheY-like chemotaxis protein
MATRILVIEDNPANMELVRYVLEAFGYAVIEARIRKFSISVFPSDQS